MAFPEPTTLSGAFLFAVSTDMEVGVSLSKTCSSGTMGLVAPVSKMTGGRPAAAGSAQTSVVVVMNATLRAAASDAVFFDFPAFFLYQSGASCSFPPPGALQFSVSGLLAV